jgi:hypothetical protein
MMTTMRMTSLLLRARTAVASIPRACPNRA